MNSLIATAATMVLIAVLFAWDRDKKVRTSKVLWIPVFWIMIAGSRNVSEWLQMQGPSDGGNQYLEGSPIDRNVLAACEVIALVALMSGGRRAGKLLRENTPILMYFAYCGMSVLWADYPFVGIKRWIRAVGDVLMVLVVLTDPNWVAAFKRFLARAGFVLLPLSILFIRYYPDLGRAYGSSDGTLYWTGVSTGKNGLGMISQIYGLAALWRLLQVYSGRDANRKRQLYANGALLLMAVYLLYESNSMTSLACFFMAAGLLIATNFRAVLRKPALVHAMVAAIVFISVGTLFFNMGGAALQTMGRDPTLTGRTDVWKMVLAFTVNPVFGAGYESFWLGDRLARIHVLNPGINQAHNGYIEVYLNLGIIGVGLIAIILVTGYRKVIAGLRWDPEIGRLRLAYFVVGVVYNCTEAGFKMMAAVWILFLLALFTPARMASRNVRTAAPQALPDESLADLQAAHTWRAGF